MSLRSAFLSSLLCLTIVAAAASTAAAATEDDVMRGADDFRRGCAMCHGLSAKGDGRIADLLKVPPKDLTRIARRYGGEFPAEKIRKIIDGRTDIKAHGGREMPIWGLTFQDPGSTANQEAEVRERIDRLVAFLASIQESAKAQEHEEKEIPEGKTLGR